MKKTTAQKVSTAVKTANSTTNVAAQGDRPAENSAGGQAAGGQAAGLGATGKRTKRAAASTMETLFNSSPLASRKSGRLSGSCIAKRLATDRRLCVT